MGVCKESRENGKKPSLNVTKQEAEEKEEEVGGNRKT